MSGHHKVEIEASSGNGDISKTYTKDPLRLSISDPPPSISIPHQGLNRSAAPNSSNSPGLRDRRARWIQNMNRAHDQYQEKQQSESKKNSNNDSGKSSTRKKKGKNVKVGDGVRFNKSFSGKHSKVIDSGYMGDDQQDLEFLRRGQSDSGHQASTTTFDTLESTFDSSKIHGR
jgi:hypothetical protein